MEKKTLASLFAEKLYQIPDYQRGYAWEERQWNHFIQDIDALVDDQVMNHYTGTVVIYQAKDKPVQYYGSTDKLELVDVVDGQQRLTTCCLYLSIIINALIKAGQDGFKDKISTFLYSGSTCKLRLNNDTKDTFYSLLKDGAPNTASQNIHQQRLCAAYNYLKLHIDDQIASRGSTSTAYLRELFDAIVRKLNFTFYTIDEECEIGMTFELMNSRGKRLSVLELLKNYLMHWISRNEQGDGSRKDLTDVVNRSWKEVYTNIGQCGGSEDQCLRAAWTLFCTHTPKNWGGYEGFKDKHYIPLRDFSVKSLGDTGKFIRAFAEGLGEASKHFATVTSPDSSNTLSGVELLWLSKIHNSGIIANFLPLIIAARSQGVKDKVLLDDYCELLKAIECYIYRVFLFEGKRSNAGMSSLFHYGYEVHNKTMTIKEATGKVSGLTDYYSPEANFPGELAKPTSEWYEYRRALKYTLFEYELHLLSVEGKGKPPSLKWKDLSDSTIEHILPQNPDEQSQWKKDWSPSDIETYLHDIGNLVLTENNSNYLNFDFKRKKGTVGSGYCYANSDIRQERKVAAYDKWTLSELKRRRKELTDWIETRWKVNTSAPTLPDALANGESDDE